MNEINSVEKIFLSKVENILSKFNEIDIIVEEINNMIEENPNNQKQADLLLSDYYHILENDNLSDVELINISKKIHDARLYRRGLNRLNALLGCYEKHKEKIKYSVRSNREMFKQSLINVNNKLYEDYQYRVLNEEDVKELSKSSEKLVNNGKRKYGKAPTKKELEECMKQGMKNKEIGMKFNLTPSYVSVVKKKYGLNGLFIK